MMLRWCGAALVFVCVVACGNSGNGTYVPGVGGDGGTTGSGGDVGSGGSSDGGTGVGGGSGGTADGGGSGGSSDTGGSSSSGGDAGTSSSGATGGTGGAAGEPPNVLIVVEAGSTMFEPRAERWDIVYGALMDEVAGALKTNQSQIRFGFASFAAGGALGACSQISYLPPDLDNYDSVDAVYSIVQAGTSSPTGDSLSYITSSFAAVQAPGRKYLVLAIAGDPETCTVEDPECGQDAAIDAVQQAHALGISTLVLGVGEFVTPSGFCDLTQRRCGTAHLEDIANAGVGLGVAAPPETYSYSACVLSPENLRATYSAAGSAEYYMGGTVEAVRSEFNAIFTRILAGSVP